MPAKTRSLMQFKENRLATFEGTNQQGSKQKRYWIHDVPDKEQLAEFGFYYTPTKKNNDQITCFICNKKESNLDGVENIAEHHLNNHPNCPYSSIMSHQVEHLSSEDADFWSKQSAHFNDPFSAKSFLLRKKTFGSYWQFDGLKSAKTTSETLAKAGFYYCPLNESNDRVQCVYCHCPLDTWDPQDDPMTEHLNNGSGECYFLAQYLQKPANRNISQVLTPKSANNTIATEHLPTSKNGSRTTSHSDLEIFSDAVDDSNAHSETEIRVPSEIVYKPELLTKEPINVKIRNGQTSSAEKHEKPGKVVKRRKKPTRVGNDHIQKPQSASELKKKRSSRNAQNPVADAASDSGLESNDNRARRTRSSRRQAQNSHVVKSDDDALESDIQDAPRLTRRTQRSKLREPVFEKRLRALNNSDDVLHVVAADSTAETRASDTTQDNKPTQRITRSRAKSISNSIASNEVGDFYDLTSEAPRVKRAKSKKRAESTHSAESMISTLVNDVRHGNDNMHERVSNESLNNENVSSEDEGIAKFSSDLTGSRFKPKSGSKKLTSNVHKKPTNRDNRKRKLEQKDSNRTEESFDEDRFADVLKAPGNSKKIKLNQAKKMPAVPLFDISDQNIGDYDEKHLNYLERNVQQATFVGTPKAQTKQKASKAHIIDTSTESIPNTLIPPKGLQDLVTSTPTKENARSLNHAQESMEKSPAPQGDIAKLDNDGDWADDEAEKPEDDESYRSKQNQRNSLTPVRNLLPSDVSVSTDIGVDLGKSPTQGLITSKVLPIEKEEAPAELGVSSGFEVDVAIDASLPNQEFGDDIKYIMQLNQELEESMKDLSNSELSGVHELADLLDGSEPLDGQENDNGETLEKPQVTPTNERQIESIEQQNQGPGDVPHAQRPDYRSTGSPQSSPRRRSLEDPVSVQGKVDIEAGATPDVVNGTSSNSPTEDNGELEADATPDVVNRATSNSPMEDKNEVEGHTSIDAIPEKADRGRTAEVEGIDEKSGEDQTEKDDDSKHAVIEKNDDAAVEPIKPVSKTAVVPMTSTDTADAVPIETTTKNPLISNEGENRPANSETKASETQQQHTQHPTIIDQTFAKANVSKPRLGSTGWDESKLSAIEDKLKVMRNACKYLQDISESSYSLRDDADGRLTHFISTMPEEEEEMTIKQWIEHSATNCRQLVKDMCQEMIQHYRAQQDKALRLLEALPTVD